MNIKSLNFRNSKEQKPRHNQEIIYISLGDYHNEIGIETGTVTFDWEELDEDGTPTSSYIEFDPNKDGDTMEGCRLVMFINGYGGDDANNGDIWWCPLEELDQFDK